MFFLIFSKSKLKPVSAQQGASRANQGRHQLPVIESVQLYH